MEQKLNLNITERVAELESLMDKISPKNILYKLAPGRGLEFESYKDFVGDEDASLIDWKASMRANELLVRNYIEEREMKFMFVVDVGDNMVFGSTEKLKCEYCAEICGALAHLILVGGDKFGFIFFSDNIVKFQPPFHYRNAFEIFVKEISDPKAYGGKSDLDKTFEQVLKFLDKSISLVFIISDFINLNSRHKKQLSVISGLFETIAIIIRDPLDMTLPDINRKIVVEDTSGKEKLLINLKLAKKSYEQNALEQLKLAKEIFTGCNIDFLELLTTELFSEKFANFSNERLSGGRIRNVF